MSDIPLLDEAIFEAVRSSEAKVESILGADLLFYTGEMRIGYVQRFRNYVEKLKQTSPGRTTLAICLRTPGGSAEAVERMVDIVRYHYSQVFFIVPDMAMSAGTIFCMSGDKIFMDYSSGLGPIDPQVPDKDDRLLVPALGYLDKIEELIEKSRNNTITTAEILLIEKQDLAMLRAYEQAKELSIELLKKWLAIYKFKDWHHHETNSVGSIVTPEEKEKRAEDIAKMLSDNKLWHSHGRFINRNTIREKLKLRIDSLEDTPELQTAIRRYHDTLSDYLARAGQSFYLYSSRVD